ncbi:MAG: hypothetical protein E7598_03900 [Ruminococcaceae bacterium]|nr:hypothetical protein [Oscillospiraceae bacterium]
MAIDKNIVTFEEKLIRFEKEIEEANERQNTTRMKARNFMFFLILGADEKIKKVLERKVRDLLCNPDACEFWEIDDSSDNVSYGEQFEEVLSAASNKHVDVVDLNNIFLCPVVFVKDRAVKNLVPILDSIGKHARSLGRNAIWQPFTVIHRSVSQYKNIYQSLEQMKNFLSNKEYGATNRCCLLGDQDANGFAVPLENIMQTIAMTVVLQNVDKKTADADKPLLNSASMQIADNLFFTARNAAVTNPIRSLIFQRMCSAIDFFSGKTDEDSRMAASKINYSFLAPYLSAHFEKLPKIDGKITFFPLYAVMDGPDFKKRLEDVISQFYTKPLTGGEKKGELLWNAKSGFLKEYFKGNGSLSYLREVVEGKELSSILRQRSSFQGFEIEPPLPKKSNISAFTSGMYANARRYCNDEVEKGSIRALDDLAEYIASKQTLQAIAEAEDMLKNAKECMQHRIRALRDAETIFVLDSLIATGDTTADFEKEQNKWFSDKGSSGHYGKWNDRFDAMLCDILLGKAPEDRSAMLDVCYDVVKGDIGSNTDYLIELNRECNRDSNRANEFAAIVEKSWCYTLRFVKRSEGNDATCIIGDSDYAFCRTLSEKFHATVFEVPNFDRIDVLHISAPFSLENLMEWEQIEKVGGAE